MQRLIPTLGRLASLAVIIWLTAAANAGEPVRVMAAFTLKPALDAIAEEYRRSGNDVVLVYGPSPGLAQQIENGAAADLFFSADALWTDELNPVTRGAGSNITAGAVPANRAIDVAAAGASVSAEAVAAAVAKQVDASVTPVIAALQQIVQALATATTAIGNVVNQAQPKATA